MKIHTKIIGIIFSALIAFNANADTANASTDFYHFNPYGFFDDRTDNERLLISNYGIDTGGTDNNFSSYGFLMFDLSSFSTDYVSSASLTLEKFSHGSHEQASDANPLAVHVSNMGLDVSGSSSSADLINSIGAIQSTTMIGDDRTYSWDITDLVNGWLNGTIANNGIALTATPVNSTANGINAYFASSSNVDYATPLIVAIAAVPEPSVLGLMLGGLGLVGMVAYRTRKVQA